MIGSVRSISCGGSLFPQAVHDNQILIVVWDTGSGKTTQDLAEAGGRSAASLRGSVGSMAAVWAKAGENFSSVVRVIVYAIVSDYSNQQQKNLISIISTLATRWRF